MRIRIQVISLKFADFFFLQNTFKICCSIFSLIFILKLDEPFRNEEIFIISLFSKVQIWVLGVKKFFSVFCCYFTPWIRRFLRIRIQEANILRIQRIRILTTEKFIEMLYNVHLPCQKNDCIFQIFDQIKFSRVLLKIGHCYLCMDGHLVLRLQSF